MLSLKNTIAGLLLVAVIAASDAQTVPTFEQLENRGVRIGKITILRNNIFDTSDPEESKWFHRRINDLHIVTREKLIHSQLLFTEGEKLSARVIAESARLLRRNKYLYDATITVTSVHDGVADLLVTTKDIWTLTPEINVTREGGENYLTLGIEDDNLLGTGASLTLSRVEDIDRTSNLFLYSNNNLLYTRLRFGFGLSDSSDGGSFSIGLDQPFYSLDTRRAAGFSFFDFDGEETFYSRGVEVGRYARDTRNFNLYRGWSIGRQGRWVSRLSAGFAGERSRFGPPRNPTGLIGIPDNRELYYPYVSIEILEDRFEIANNFMTIDRTEDVFLGARYTASLGIASKSVGSDRDALVFSAAGSHTWGAIRGSLLSILMNTSGRLESGAAHNLRTDLAFNYSYKPSDQWQFFTKLDLRHIERPDLDRLITLGGASDLRGYPTRHRTGRGRALITVEQRYFSDWYPLRLFRVGGAVFFDAGQVWGKNSVGQTNNEFLSNAGLGLRLGSTKGGSKRVIHIDLAFPLNNKTDVDSVQLLIEAKDSF